MSGGAPEATSGERRHKGAAASHAPASSAPPPLPLCRGEFEIGDWSVQPALCRMSRGGTTLRLRPQLMDLLVCLASQPGRTITRDQLFATLWSGQFVAETGLARCVAELRQALGDSAQGARFIETVPKRGYRLVAAVRPVVPAPPVTGTPSMVNEGTEPRAYVVAPTPARGLGRAERVLQKRWVWVLLAALPTALAAGVYLLEANATVRKASIALIFGDGAAEGDEGSVEAALARALASDTFQLVPEARVREAARNAGREDGAGDVPPLSEQVCRTLGATAVVKGSVARFGQRYVISLEALACETGQSLARAQAESGSREGLQEAASRAASALSARLEQQLPFYHPIP